MKLQAILKKIYIELQDLQLDKKASMPEIAQVDVMHYQFIKATILNNIKKLPLSSTQLFNVSKAIFSFVSIKLKSELSDTENHDLIAIQQKINQAFDDISNLFQISAERIFSLEEDAFINPLGEILHSPELISNFPGIHIISTDHINESNIETIGQILYIHFKNQDNTESRRIFTNRFIHFLKEKSAELWCSYFIELFFDAMNNEVLYKEYSAYFNYTNGQAYLNSRPWSAIEAINEIDKQLTSISPETKHIFTYELASTFAEQPFTVAVHAKYYQRIYQSLSDVFFTIYGKNEDSKRAWQAIKNNNLNPLEPSAVTIIDDLYSSQLSRVLGNVSTVTSQLLAKFGTRTRSLETQGYISGILASYTQLALHPLARTIIHAFALQNTPVVVTTHMGHIHPTSSNIFNFGVFNPHADMIKILQPIEEHTLLSHGGMFFNEASNLAYSIISQAEILFHETLHAVQKCFQQPAILPFKVGSKQEVAYYKMYQKDLAHVNYLQDIVTRVLQGAYSSLDKNQRATWQTFEQLIKAYIGQYQRSDVLQVKTLDKSLAKKIHTSFQAGFPQAALHKQLSAKMRKCHIKVTGSIPYKDQQLTTLEIHGYPLSEPTTVALDLMKVIEDVTTHPNYPDSQKPCEVLNTLPFFSMGTRLTAFLLPNTYKYYTNMLAEVDDYLADNIQQRLLSMQASTSSSPMDLGTIHVDESHTALMPMSTTGKLTYYDWQPYVSRHPESNQPLYTLNLYHHQDEAPAGTITFHGQPSLCSDEHGHDNIYNITGIGHEIIEDISPFAVKNTCPPGTSIPRPSTINQHILTLGRPFFSGLVHGATLELSNVVLRKLSVPSKRHGQQRLTDVLLPNALSKIYYYGQLFLYYMLDDYWRAEANTPLSRSRDNAFEELSGLIKFTFLLFCVNMMIQSLALLCAKLDCHRTSYGLSQIAPQVSKLGMFYHVGVQAVYDEQPRRHVIDRVFAAGSTCLSSLAGSIVGTKLISLGTRFFEKPTQHRTLPEPKHLNNPKKS